LGFLKRKTKGRANESFIELLFGSMMPEEFNFKQLSDTGERFPDYDLKDFINNKTIECKSDYRTQKTGNLYLVVAQYNRTTGERYEAGLLATKADVWIHSHPYKGKLRSIAFNPKELLNSRLFDISEIKEKCATDDGNLTDGVLINVSRLLLGIYGVKGTIIKKFDVDIEIYNEYIRNYKE